MKTLLPALPSCSCVWRMVRLVVPVCVLLLPWMVATRPSAAATRGQIPKVRLSVSVALPSYPREALVRVTVQLRNVSRVPIEVGSAEAVECSRIGPSAVVLSEQGNQVYPGALHGGLQGSCGPHGLDNPESLRPLLPGQTATRHPYVIMRGPAIQAIGTYYFHAGGGYVRAHATSKPLVVSLYDAPKPTLTLTTSSLSATIAPGTAAPAGKLRFVYQWLCPDPLGAAGTGPMVNWLPVAPDSAGTYKLTPGCARPYQWHVAAGFPNEPVVYIDYCRPSRWGCG